MRLPKWEESWKVVISLLPADWQRQARRQGAVERLRGFGSVEDLLHTALLHVGQGYSLRETVVRAKAAGIGAVSDVALLKRLRKCESWLRWLCVSLLAEEGVEMPAGRQGWRVRALDGTVVKEPGRTGSQWRIHYSLQLPSMLCDHLEVTAVKGSGTGEQLQRFTARRGDLVLGDRGLCRPGGIARVVAQGAQTIVRVNTGTLPLYTERGQRFDLRKRLRGLSGCGVVGDWSVRVGPERGASRGRVCALRKSQQQAQRALRKIRRKAQTGGGQPRPETLEFARSEERRVGKECRSGRERDL